jgi:hypothetical protein
MPLSAIATDARVNGHDGLGETVQALLRLPEGPAERNERVELLQRLLGVPACRQLGIYPIPEGFKLSVVIPV